MIEPSRPPSEASSTPGQTAVATFSLVALAIRIFALILDPHPRFFLGDSESYLSTALGTWIPNDRSWTYGLGAHALIGLSHSLLSIVIVQTAATAAMSVAAATTCQRLGARPWIAWAALIATSLDPLGLFYDRSIMTDAPGTAAAVGGVLLAGVLTMGSGWPAAAGAAVLLLTAVSLRTALLPLAACASAFVLVLAGIRVLRSRAGMQPRWRVASLTPLAKPTALAGAVAVGLITYAVATGALTRSPPSLNPRGGYFMVGVVAPILAPTDFAGLGMEDPAEALLQAHSRDRSRRNWQVFAPQGIATRLAEAMGNDWQRVSRAGSILARRAIWRDPLGYGALVAAQARDYLTLDPYFANFGAAFGLDRTLPQNFAQSLQARVGERIDPDLPARESVALAWLRAATPWPMVLAWLALVLPAASLATIRWQRPEHRAVIALLATCVWTYLGSIFALSPEIVPRYLLPLAPLSVILAGATGEASLRAIGRPVPALASGPRTRSESRP